jgi:hypothetical protein
MSATSGSDAQGAEASGIEAADEIGHCGATAKASLARGLCKGLTLCDSEQSLRPSDLIDSFILCFGGPFQTAALICGQGP